MTDPATSESSVGSGAPRTVTGTLRYVISRSRRDPMLFVPFLLAGIVVTLLDEARRRDPIPARPTSGTADIEISVGVFSVPSGTPTTTRTLAGLLDLQPRLLSWALGLELLGIVVVALAGYLTVSRLLGTEWSPTGAGTYLLYVGLVTGFGWPVGQLQFGFSRATLAISLLVLTIALGIAVQLFAVPAAIVDGGGLAAAVKRSNAAVRGRRFWILGVIAALELVTWLVSFAPLVPTLASFALVGPLHALAVAVVFETRTVSG